MEYTEAKVKDIFVDFLKGYKDAHGELKYRIQISQLPPRGGKSIVVDYPDLLRYNTDLATSLIREPESFLKSFDDAAFETLYIENPAYADKIKKELRVRIRELTDRLSLRGVTKTQLNSMILVAGMVTRTSELRPLAVNAAFRCSNQHITFIEQNGVILKRPAKCDTEDCGETKNFELDEIKTEFIDFQVIKIQEMPEELPPGQLPQSFDVHLTSDIVNTARPGDRIVLTGIVKAESEYAGGSTRLRLFSTRIIANFVEPLGKRPEEAEISREEEEQIRALASSPGAYDRIITSVAPAILGHELHKEAVLLLMVGSPQKTLPDGSTLRGDISLLLVGDPGTAKSELLKYVARVAPRGLYTSGRGTTAAGLTAAVVKEKNGMMMLEAGATVLADLGVACLHPSSRIVFNGRIATVKELSKGVEFQRGFSEGRFSEVGKLVGSLPSLNTNTLMAERATTSKVRRRWHEGELVKLKLRSGFDIRVTPDHLLLDGNTLVWKEAGSFKPKDSVVSPLLIPQQSNSEKVSLWDILPDRTKVSLTEEERRQLKHLVHQKFGAIAKAGRVLELPRLANLFRQRLQPSLRELKNLTSALGVELTWKRLPHIYDKSKLLVSEVTPEFGYLCGFVLGDGYVSISKRHVTITIHQSLVHSAYIEQFRSCWSKVFAVPFKIGDARLEESVIHNHQVTSRSVNWHVSRRVLASVYNHLTQNNLENILSLPNEVLSGFISGLTDADGCITKKNSMDKNESFETWNIVYTFSAKKESNLNLLLALRRFDCLGAYKGVKRNVGIIVVSSRRDCIQLQKALTLSLKMQTQPTARRYNISGKSEKIPSVPVAEIIRQAFAQIPRTELIKLGIWSTIYEAMNLKRQASVPQIERILSRYLAMPVEYRNALARLTNRDYFLDDVMTVARSQYHGFVYDLVLNGENHNFVANGIFVHNCIDEFDKMRDEDRSALHEVMEQQTASVAKGGIIATLNARTSILAAANPVDGKYDPYKNILDNVSLPIPLLTRFDLVFIIRDEADPSRDESVAKHILDMRAKSSFPTQPAVGLELLKKYIIYAKKIDPELTEEARTRLSSFYIKLRREASPEQISVTPRWLEGMIRLSIARSRVLLHPRVTEDDALHAIKLIERMLNTVAIDQTTKKVDVGVLYNRPVSEKGLREAALEVFKKLSGESKQPVENKAFYDELVKSGSYSREQAEKVFQDMYRSGVIYEVKPNFFKKT